MFRDDRGLGIDSRSVGLDDRGLGIDSRAVGVDGIDRRAVGV